MDYQTLLKQFYTEINNELTDAQRRLTIQKFYKLSKDYIKENFLNDTIIYYKTKKNFSIVEICTDMQFNIMHTKKIEIKKSIKNLDVEKLTFFTKNNDIDLSKYITIPTQLSSLVKDSLEIDNYPWTTLHEQLNQNHKINNIAKVNARKYKEKNSLFQLAIKNNDLPHMFELMKKGINIHVDNDFYLHLAAEYNHPHAVEFLLKEGCDPNTHHNKALYSAFKYNNFDLCKTLIIYGSSVPEHIEKGIKNNRISIDIDNLNKEILFYNTIFNLQQAYLSNKKPIKKFKELADPFDIILSIDNHNKEKLETIHKKDKEKILSPFDTNFSFINQIETVSNAKPILNKNEKKSPLTFINLNGEKLSTKKLQQQWDESLILAFAHNENCNMRQFFTQFMKNNFINSKLLKDNNIVLKRMPIKQKSSQWISKPYHFVCLYLPQLSDLLLKQKFVEIPDNMNFYIKQISLLNMDTNLCSSKQIKERNDTHIHAKKTYNSVLTKAKLMREIYNFDKEERNPHNWHKVK